MMHLSNTYHAQTESTSPASDADTTLPSPPTCTASDNLATPPVTSVETLRALSNTFSFTVPLFNHTGITTAYMR